MSSHASTPRLTLNDLRRLAATRKLAMLTCYDAAFAATLDAAGVDILLIGDSLGMVVQGHDSTLPVTVADVAYHTACVARGAARPWIVADMPFGSFQASPEQAFAGAVTLMQAGSQMVKIEGGAEMAPTVEFMVRRGVPVCAHIGLTPQHVNVFGGYRVQGRGAGAAEALLASARALQDAGAAMMVIEAVPEPLARRVAEEVALITIGIGASVACSGQVLVLHDMLGAGVGKRPRFVRNFLQGAGSLEAAVGAYVDDVRAGRFPGPEHVYAEAAGG
ncbi:MAG: 3-methyl-2-oxobutanoate hydroxymethyltransferase [Burkholderiaceae bacterium]|jgi:3-methyl-2-oxobutanoate hydroxymethyltransferase|nr:3-methyl-2-oxobutanoate hydroxymethyltransferase [Burkholderiaceae bacterium]